VPQAIEGGDPLASMFDVRCNVDVVVGTGALTLRECLTLRRDQIVRLVEAAGSDLSIRVHGVTLAAGEVVILEDMAALRITRVVPPAGVEG
jgi:flagellar motor switch/type III secretory pathway protein FliN